MRFEDIDDLRQQICKAAGTVPEALYTTDEIVISRTRRCVLRRAIAYSIWLYFACSHEEIADIIGMDAAEVSRAIKVARTEIKNKDGQTYGLLNNAGIIC